LRLSVCLLLFLFWIGDRGPPRRRFGIAGAAAVPGGGRSHEASAHNIVVDVDVVDIVDIADVVVPHDGVNVRS